ncbi:glycosyltransferase family 77 protein [Mucilaginibacter sp. 14171R-50]|uniref:putative nucleotide-diphospho-sugar transferase n=1 Tax=Mucilaginibacter sp. 14171R-50 TaxID=2703789 RepID=UPI00138D03B9|nr:putative nucleotide-diphospho-sugar transferase [Mucilaginibacter sp. 14171R-50]QHS54811.1 glycosyltransferase family 77 protein [Mucilaginibacter sp. 14171R-50]
MFHRIKNSIAFRFPVWILKPLLSVFTTVKTTSKPAANFNYVILCGRDSYPFLKQVLSSIQKVFSELPSIYLITDFGTTNQTIKNIRKTYPGDRLTVITAEQCVQYHLKQGNKLLAAYATKSPMGLKLAGIMQIVDLGRPVLYTDTDVLWHNDPLADIRYLTDGDIDLHMSYDKSPAYDRLLIKNQNLAVLTEEPYYCAGIMFIKQITAQHKEMINRLLPSVIANSTHFSEQTIFAYLQKVTGTSGLMPHKYLLTYTDQFEIIPTFLPDVIARHYVGPVRHLFWRDAFARKIGFLKNKQRADREC